MKNKQQNIWALEIENQSKKLDRMKCVTEAEVLVDLNLQSTPFEIFWTAIELDNLIEIISAETNKYVNQNDRNFETTKEEVLALLSINFIIAVNRLPCTEDDWSTDWFMGNKSIQNVMTKTRFQATLQSLHFTDNQKKDKADKGFKFRPVMKHFNVTLTLVLGNSKYQSTDEHMCKFEGISNMKQFIKSKPIKLGFKFWYRNTEMLIMFINCSFNRDEKPQLNSILVNTLCCVCAKICKIGTATSSSTTISTVQQLFKSYMSRDYMFSELFKLDENTFQKWNRITRYNGMVIKSNTAMISHASNEWIINL